MLIISKYISLATTNTNREILLDPEDYELISKYIWRETVQGYAVSSMKPNIRMHGLITGCDESLCVDHINHNKLDNRRVNLRTCTISQNQMNRQPSKGKSSKYKGVSYDKRRKCWAVGFEKDNQRYFVGRFQEEDEAAIAYNKAVLKIHGDFALLNAVDES